MVECGNRGRGFFGADFNLRGPPAVQSRVAPMSSNPRVIPFGATTMKSSGTRTRLAVLGALFCMGLAAIAHGTAPAGADHVALRGQWFLDSDGEHGALRQIG